MDTAKAWPMSQLVGKFTHEDACEVMGVSVMNSNSSKIFLILKLLHS